MFHKTGELEFDGKGAVQTTATALTLKKKVVGVARLFVSITFIVYLLNLVDISDLRVRLQLLQLPLFLLAITLGFIRILFFASRWKLALSVVDSSVSLIQLVKYYLIGTFYNLFLPTALGGDVVRGYDFAMDSGKVSTAVTSVIVERIVGFFALVMISYVALAFGWSLVQGSIVVPIVLLFGLGYMLFVILVFNRSFSDLVINIALSKVRWRLISQLRDFVKEIQFYALHVRVIGGIFLLSIIAQVLDIVGSYLIARAIGLEISPVFFFIAIPMIWIITMFPLSINGLGVREGAFVFFFTRAGASLSAALTLSFLYFIQMVLVGLSGGIVHLVEQTSPMIRRISRKITS